MFRCCLMKTSILTPHSVSWLMRMARYIPSFMFPSMACNIPVLFAEKQHLIMMYVDVLRCGLDLMLPSPCFTEVTEFSGWNAQPFFLWAWPAELLQKTKQNIFSSLFRRRSGDESDAVQFIVYWSSFSGRPATLFSWLQASHFLLEWNLF